MQKHFFANKLISTAADSFITDAPYGENCVLKLHGERNKGRRGKGKGEGGRNKDTGRWPNKMQTWILSRSEGGVLFQRHLIYYRTMMGDVVTRCLRNYSADCLMIHSKPDDCSGRDENSRLKYRWSVSLRRRGFVFRRGVNNEGKFSLTLRSINEASFFFNI